MGTSRRIKKDEIRAELSGLIRNLDIKAPKHLLSMREFQHDVGMSKIRRKKQAVKKHKVDAVMTMDERHKHILGLLEAEAKIRVEDLADRLDVSQVTMRKDLDILEKQGLLERIHGSAVFSQQNRLNISFLEELQTHAAAKKLIAEAALSYIHEGDSIILEAGPLPSG